MDLALHLGTTAAGLSSAMSERELRQWQRYDERRGLPLRRIELYLAQIAKWVALSAGIKDARLDDFLFKPRADEADEVAEGDDLTLEDIAAQFGAVVHKKG